MSTSRKTDSDRFLVFFLSVPAVRVIGMKSEENENGFENSPVEFSERAIESMMNKSLDN